MSACNPDWIDWHRSEAKFVILYNLENGILPLDNDKVSAEEAWEVQYHHMQEFQNVVFSQFKERLCDYGIQVRQCTGASYQQLEAMHDHLLYPWCQYNQQGECIFNLSTAKPKLQEDIVDEKHKEMTIEELHASCDEYLE